jgi:asparagine synthase (glutamine-hydrolysing)
MCGIAGVFSQSKFTDVEIVKKMTDVIRHRGPDGDGHWSNSLAGIALGHRRLSIIDLSQNASQPMHYDNSRYTIVFNGEIYNYLELKERLIKDGFKFKTESDTEVILALYSQKKEHCLGELNGMFAFALWDEVEQKLFCARDRFGEKPFYYHFEKGKGFFFASEMKALWAAGVAKEPEAVMIQAFINNNSCSHLYDQGLTFFNGIKQIDSGHYLTLSTSDFEPRISKFYSLVDIAINRDLGFEEATKHFYHLLTESVKLRLRADVPIGSSLSGGLDSSSIVLLLDCIKDKQRQKTFSARFDNFEKDEGTFINLVTQKCKNVDHFEVWPNQSELESVIEKILWHHEEPFGSASIFAQWKVMELARKNGVTVLLDGQGADEQLAGYLHYYNIYLAQIFQHDYPLFKKEVSSLESLRGIRHHLHPKNQSVKNKLGRIKRSLFKESMNISEQHLSNTLKMDMMNSALKELLRYADRNSMAHSVEVRLPFLDHKLVEFVFSLPDEFKLAEGWTKLLLRKSMQNILPAEITWRLDKVSYEAPQNDWLCNVRTKVTTTKICEFLNDKGIEIGVNEVDSIALWNYYLVSKMSV